MDLPANVVLVDVGPRDGLQNEARPVSTDAKASQLSKARTRSGSTGSPRSAPSRKIHEGSGVILHAAADDDFHVVAHCPPPLNCRASGRTSRMNWRGLCYR